MSKRLTIADVAQRAGVSPSAVSLALNGRPGVGDETRQRIVQAAAELGWQPNRSARALSRGRAFAMGLILSREPQLIGADPFFPSFIAGVESVLAARGEGLLLQMVGTDPEQEEAAYRRLAADGRVDGVFLLDLRVDDPRPALVASLDLPAVVVGGPECAQGLPWVALDDGPAVTEAVLHLVSLGHRHIAHVAGPQEYVHAKRRRTAWQAALRDAGLEPGPLQHAGFSAESGARATRALLTADTPPTAIVYVNDLTATAGMAVAQQLGLALPDDLSVTGFDDTELASWTHPSLTTCRVNTTGWGQAAARCLVELVETGEAESVELPPAQLLVRGSTGRPREGAGA